MLNLKYKIFWVIYLFIGLVFLTNCSEKEDVLTGQRFSLDVSLEDSKLILAGEDTNTTKITNKVTPIDLPSPTNHSHWTHRNGNAKHRLAHLGLSDNPKLIWKLDIGKGNSSKFRLTSDPVVVDDKIYVMDSSSSVSRVSVEGLIDWKVSLIPPLDSESDTSAGGIAYGAKKIFASTGFGELFALSPGNGDVIWKHRFKAPINSAPTIIDEHVFVITANGQAFALDVATGRIKWQQQSTLAGAMLLGGSSVADYRRLALLPFDSGELTAVLKSSGIRIWSASVSTTRKGSARSNINSVTSDPVVFNDVIYTANQGGRLVALNANDGIRKWTDKDGSYSPIWVVDNSVFIVTDIAQLKRLDINSGELIWSADLPKYPNKKKRNKSYAHYGPLLAGGKLWVASSDGFLRAFEPVSGNIFNKIKLPHGAASHASVVNGVYYILNQQGQLLAFK
jgi:outer membrane protein assembly factor BamB